MEVELPREDAHNWVQGWHPHHSTMNFKQANSTQFPEFDQNYIIEKVTKRVLDLALAGSDSHDIIDCFCNPGISLAFFNFVIRLVEEVNRKARDRNGPKSIGICCAILAVEYLERLQSQRTSLRTLQAYFVTAYMVGFKLMDDYYVSNTFFGNLSGYSLQHINQMESTFCCLLNWNIGVTAEAYWLQRNKLVLAKTIQIF